MCHKCTKPLSVVFVGKMHYFDVILLGPLSLFVNGCYTVIPAALRGVGGRRLGCRERAGSKSHLAGRSEEIRRQSDSPTDAHHHVPYSPCRPAYDLSLHLNHIQVDRTLVSTLLRSLVASPKELRQGGGTATSSCIVNFHRFLVPLLLGFSITHPSDPKSG